MSAEDIQVVKGIVARWELACIEERMSKHDMVRVEVPRIRRLLAYIRWLEERIPDMSKHITELERNADRQV